ncbi:MAG: hypothetical protein AB7E60_05360 [Sphingobium sp.]
MTEIETIAAGLSEAQRRAIQTGQSGGGGCWPMRNALARKGIAQAMPFRLTPLGLQLRRYLQENQNDR